MIYCTMREMWDICSYIKVDPSTMFDGTIVVEDRDVIGDVSAAGRKHCVSLELSPEDAESIRELVAFCEGEVDGDVEGLVEIIDDAIDEYRRTYT